MKNEYHIPVKTKDETAVELLAMGINNLSRQKIKQAMQKGCVWLETKDTKGKPFIQRLRRAKKLLVEGDILHCYYDEEVLNTEPTPASLVSDEGDYSIWNKPPGMLSQGSKWGDHCTINRWAEKNLKPERPAFIVHRLDRAASGLILIAHKKSVAALFSKMFQQHEIEKHYLVTVIGDFGKIIESTGSSKTMNTDIDGKSAISHALLLHYDAEKHESILDVHIETGRKHQIRKHLSRMGFPVVGDRLYGSKNHTRDLQLTALSLDFICPITIKKISVRLK